MFEKRYFKTVKVEEKGKLKYVPKGNWGDFCPDQATSHDFEGESEPREGSWMLMTGWGLLVVDVDSGKPEVGQAALANWEMIKAKYGLSEETYTVKTKSGGHHYYYSIPVDANVTISEGKVGVGIDIRCNRGFVYAPPTDNYVIEKNVALAAAPIEFVKLCAKFNGDKKKTKSVGAEVGTRNSTLFKSACSLRNQGMTEEQILSEITAENLKYKSPVDASEVSQLVASACKYPMPTLFTELEVITLLRKDKTYITFDKQVYKRTDTGYALSNKAELNEYVYALLGKLAADCTEKLAASIQKVHFADKAINSFTENSTEYDNPVGKIISMGKEINMADDSVTPAGFTPITTTIAPSKIPTPIWNQVLVNIFGNDPETINYIQRCVGCTLSGNSKDEAFFILWGHGNNGKSTFTDTIQYVLGDHYSVSIESSALVRKRMSSSAPYEVARLHRKRMVLAQEAQDGVLDEEAVKKMSSGDTISARHIYGSPFNFKPTHKVWMTTNHKPILRNNDTGILRRIHFIPFNNDVSKTPILDVKESLLSEASGILQWCIDGYKMYLKDGIKSCASVENATEEYIHEQDPVEEFIKDMGIVDAKDSEIKYEISTKVMLDEYNAWAGSTEQHFNKYSFVDRMRKLGYPSIHTVNGSRYRGIHLKQSSIKFSGQQNYTPVGDVYSMDGNHPVFGGK